MPATHIDLFHLHRDLLWPFFMVSASVTNSGAPPDPKVHRDYAETRCKFQIDYLLREVLPELQRWLPRLCGDEVPEWLGRTDPQRSLDRVTAMLMHLEESLATRPALSGDYHAPLYFGHEGKRQYATSPALLAMHAIVYSHARWGARYFHDVESAVKAEVLLSHYPAWIHQCVASLVLLKNIFRTTVAKEPLDRETGVWNGSELKFDDDSLLPALGRFVTRLWQPPAKPEHDRPAEGSVPEWWRRLLVALSLVAECYDARVGASNEDSSSAVFTCYKDLQDRLCKHLPEEPAAGDDASPPVRLVVFEFGHYVFDKTGHHLRETIVRSLVGTDPSDILWISLSRYWALHHGRHMADTTLTGALVECIAPKNDQDEPAFIHKNGVTVGYHFLDLDSTATTNQKAAFQVAFGFEDKASDVWERLGSVIDALCKERQSATQSIYNGIPWAYVTRALEILAHIYRQDFFTIQVERPQPLLESKQVFAAPPAEPPSNRIALPRIAPTVDDLERCVESEDWRDPKLLIPRALAALLVNQRMTFGNPRQIVRLNPDWRGDLKPTDPEAEKLRRRLTQEAWDWLACAEWIAERDGHQVLRNYLDIFSGLPVDPVQPPPTPVASNAHSRAVPQYVLGIDIGATGIKFAVYAYDPKSQKLGDLITQGNLDTAVGPQESGKPRRRYKDVPAFVKRIVQHLKQVCSWDGMPSGWFDGTGTLAALGVTWPGAVGGEPGHERVRAWSKILAEFKGYKIPDDKITIRGKYFFEANAQEIHNGFQVREAFAKAFFGGDERHAPVTLINDGDGHVLHAMDCAIRDGATFAPHQDVAVLAAGSGTAMGAIDAATGRLLDLLAEAGKVIVDLGEGLANAANPGGKNYPKGTGGPLFSKTTLANLAKTVLTHWKIVETVEITSNKKMLRLTNAALAALRDDVPNASEDTSEELAAYFTDSLLVGYLLEKDWDGKQAVEKLWKGKKRNLAEVVGILENALKVLAPDTDGKAFAFLAARLMGYNLADLVALTTELFQTRSVHVAGGPMSGATGDAVLTCAKDELSRRYGFHLAEPGKHELGSPHRLARLLRLERVAPRLDEPSGAHGAAVRAAYLLRQQAEL